MVGNEIFKFIFWYENYCTSVEIPQKYIPRDPVKPPLAQIGVTSVLR